jgi:hypothetical protein
MVVPRAALADSGLTWLRTVPIPGTTKLARLEENIRAVELDLTDGDLREIDDAASKIRVQGARYRPLSPAMRIGMFGVDGRQVAYAGDGGPERAHRFERFPDEE